MSDRQSPTNSRKSNTSSSSSSSSEENAADRANQIEKNPIESVPKPSHESTALNPPQVENLATNSQPAASATIEGAKVIENDDLKKNKASNKGDVSPKETSISAVTETKVATEESVKEEVKGTKLQETTNRGGGSLHEENVPYQRSASGSFNSRASNSHSRDSRRSSSRKNSRSRSRSSSSSSRNRNNHSRGSKRSSSRKNSRSRSSSSSSSSRNRNNHSRGSKRSSSRKNSRSRSSSSSSSSRNRDNHSRGSKRSSSRKNSRSRSRSFSSSSRDRNNHSRGSKRSSSRKNSRSRSSSSSSSSRNRNNHSRGSKRSSSRKNSRSRSSSSSSSSRNRNNHSRGSKRSSSRKNSRSRSSSSSSSSRNRNNYSRGSKRNSSRKNSRSRSRSSSSSSRNRDNHSRGSKRSSSRKNSRSRSRSSSSSSRNKSKTLVMPGSENRGHHTPSPNVLQSSPLMKEASVDGSRHSTHSSIADLTETQSRLQDKKRKISTAKRSLTEFARQASRESITTPSRPSKPKIEVLQPKSQLAVRGANNDSFVETTDKEKLVLTKRLSTTVRQVLLGQHLPEHMKARHQAGIFLSGVQKMKEEKESKRAHLDARHEYIIEAITRALRLERIDVEDAMLEGHHLVEIDSFFAPKGKAKLMFYYQEAEAIRIEGAACYLQLGRSDNKPFSPRSNRMKLFITDGTDQALTGQCVFFLRTNRDKPITPENIHREVNMQQMDAREGGVLYAIEKMLGQIYIPALKANKSGWGELSKTPQGEVLKKQFLNGLESFVGVLSGSRESLGEKVMLQECHDINFGELHGPAEYAEAAASTETLELVENCMKVWIKQIQQVLAEGEQLRREADNIGPRAELDHWKRRTSKFNFLLEQLKSQRVRAVLGILHLAKSKLIPVWRELDARITDVANEAKDNVKYLQTLEKFCDPLYNCDPIGMVDAVPHLINAIRMIHSISRYYNTSEKMTSLFLKVTNQMVSSCKSYISNDGVDTIWELPRAEAIEKLEACVRLNQEYQKCFQKTKQRLEETPNERNFDVSEMLIFGKFVAFERRLQKILSMFDTIRVYSALEKSKIEGLEPMVGKYQVIVTNMRKKPYNALDQRHADFDNDFDDFNNNINDLHNQIIAFINQKFERLYTTASAVLLLRKFERLDIPDLNIEEKYQNILSNYGRDVDAISRIYTKQRNEPSIPRDTPPIAGKIMWARQLYRRIQEPMDLFQQEAPHLLKGSEAKRIIRNYNKVAKVLLEFEVLYHRGWIRQVDNAKAGLQASLLVRHPDTNELYVNFDPMILTLIKETDCMRRLDLDIPLTAVKIQQKQAQLKDHSNKLNHLLNENLRVRRKILPAIEPMMGPHVAKLDDALEPGLTVLSWTSVRIDRYIEDAHQALAELDLLLDRVTDLVEFRIEAVLADMAKTKLVELPTDQPMTITDFVQATKDLCTTGAITLQTKSKLVEEATNELIDMLLDFGGQKSENQDVDDTVQDGSPSPPINRSSSITPVSRGASARKKGKKDIVQIMEEEAKELLCYFNHRNIDALLKVIKSTLEALRKRIISPSLQRYISGTSTQVHGKSSSRLVPLLRSNAVLAIPQIGMSPKLEEVQLAITRAAEYILLVMRGVSQWNKERISPKSNTAGDKRRQSVGSVSCFSESSISATTFASGTLLTSQTQTNKSVGATSLVNASLSRSVSKMSLVELTSQPAVLDIKTQSKNYYKAIRENKDVSKLYKQLCSCINSTAKEVHSVLEEFERYHHVWKLDKDTVLADLHERSPTVDEFEQNIISYKMLIDQINSEPQYLVVGSIALFTEDLKLALVTECKNWMAFYGKHCNIKYRAKMEEIFAFIDDVTKRMTRPVKDLDDIRIVMGSLKEIRERQIDIDMNIIPIETSYSIHNKFDLAVPKEESERVDTLRYALELVLTQATEQQHHLMEIQPNFRGELISNIEQFQGDCKTFFTDYHKDGPMVEGVPPQEASDRLIIFQNRFDTIWRKYNTYSGGEELFGLPITPYPELHEIRRQLSLLQKLYGLYNNVIETVNGYYDIMWSEIDIEKINDELSEFQNRCRKLPRGLREWQAFQELKKKIDDFSETCPLLELMSNKAMKERHWERISAVTKHTFDVENDAFTLRGIMEAPLLEFKEDIEDICIAAVKEKDIEAKLKQVVAEWDSHEFVFASFKNRGELLLRGDHTSEIVTAIEDSLMILSSLMSNRYNAPFRSRIQKWVQNLTNTTEIIENWMTVQNLWVYLEAVFVGGDIAKQLPKEAKRFSNIDKSWVRIMTRAHETVKVVPCCVGDETMQQLLPHLLEQLELCQKSLTGYLEKKRLLFPRFFFVSDPALLEILGQASDSHTIQAHLLNVFDNIKTVRFHDKIYDRILAISSKEGETIDLVQHVLAEGNVEIWLQHLLDKSRLSVHGIIRTAYMAIQDPSFMLINFLNTFPAQVGVLGIQLIWTKDATEALSNAKYDRKIMQTTNKAFLDLLNTLINMTTQDLTKTERTKYETLITIHVHQRDIFDELVKKNIKSPTDFDWQKQCRFYFDEDRDKTIASITDVDFIYQNEFLGCTERLVITPLTDRCYITLAQALGMSMGGAPAGPAGTGKTETTKDMGKALGKYVVVFNCSDQMDFRGLGRIFKGLAQSGSWGCFDEFNRIELPVLSVAAQQIAVVLQAKKERKKKFIFTDGDEVNLNPEFGIFLTMNPGYAGRQELPENLKIHFRNVAMMVPDRQIIIRVKLAAVGFIDNIVLARKFYILYKLCEEQLTKQVHYDFGLRNILSVLRTLGAAKRANPDDTENMTVMRVLRDMNLSKLIDEDEPLFLSLIGDLFPGITLDKGGYPDLEAAIKNRVEETGLVHHPPWVLKVIQLFETQRVRHGMMALGPSGGGKTSCIHILMKAMTDCGQPHREMRMNPKAITAPQMFGRLDVATNDWTDGIFSTLWRRTLRAKKGEHVWLVLDGPVDTIWIENLNSVLDDNKTLTLANGDRIPMAPNCKIIFEPHNIDNASPATVSRNGMVFMSSSVLDWSPILQAWLKTRPESEAEIIWRLFERCFAVIYRYAVQNLIFKMDVLEAFIIRQCIVLMDGLVLHEKRDTSQDQLNKIFVFTLMWSIGALLELDDRRKLQTFMTETEGLDLSLPEVAVDAEDTIFDYLVDEEGKWAHWATRVADYHYPPDSTPEYGSILVPNVDNVRADFLIRACAKQGKGVLLIGEQGTAKTVMVKGFLSSHNPEEHLSKNMNFSSATTPMMFQRTIESYVEKRMGSTYGPPAGKKMTVFVDDINMPVINEWGDQITNEIVRQLLENNGFYNLDKPGDFTNIEDMQFIAAMIHPGGGRNDIPQRLKRQFAIFNCTLPSNPSIDKIFGVIGCGHFCAERGFSDIINLLERLVPLTRKLWQTTKTKMLPTPAKFHYVFNLRDLSRIWQGMLKALSEVVDSKSKLMQLWKHECTRVISDRFTNQDDRNWFDKSMTAVASMELGQEYGSMVECEPYFVDFLREPPEPTGDEPDDFDFSAPKIYDPIPSFEFLEEKLASYMEQMNETIRGSKMDLVFFRDAMIHLMKISRIIGTPRGNALLVGVGGSGKQSLTKLASFIAGYSTFQITLSRSYNTGNLMDDLKILYRNAGLHGKGVTFIFTDNEIKEESFLEYMNNVLSSGEVPNLFARDEMDEILQELIPIMKKEFPRRPPTNENLYDYFMTRVRQYLHVVLCFSPVGEKFRNRSLKFPALISGCTMDWFQRWPKDALIAVSTHFLHAYEIKCSAVVKKQVQEAMGTYHDEVAITCNDYFQRFRRSTHVTPKSYLSFIQGYKEIYTQKETELNEQANRMQMGLEKLQEAGRSVQILSEELVEKEKELEVANRHAQKILEEVTSQAQAAAKVKQEVQKVKDKAQHIVDAIAVDKVKAEEKLLEAKPALEQAENALKTIQPADIATVRRLGHPPNLIMRIMDCVLILFQRRLDSVSADSERPNIIKPSWGEALKMMTESGFLTKLQNFNKDSINDEVVGLMKPYFDAPDYNMDVAARVCGNVAGLCSWTQAMANFYVINKEVLPLKANLAVQEARYNTAMQDLQAAEEELAEKNRELAVVQARYDAAMKEKQELTASAEACRHKMQTATSLISVLGGEKERWTAQSKEFTAQTRRLVGDVLMATAFLSYAGPFNQEFRGLLLGNWQSEMRTRRIPYSDGLNLIDMLADSATITEWNLQGLPNDELSIQNGIIVTKAARYPLLIDPQGQGKIWIKNRESNSELQLTSLHHKYFRTHLEDALSIGRPLLIEDVGEELDPALDNVLDKNFIKLGSTLKVKVGDKEVDVMKGFKLYITTKLPNPAYTPEISARTSIIDFTVTVKGLEDQLLGRVILTEKQELEKERNDLLSGVTQNKRKMKELEDNLLYRLTSTKGSLVEDESLLGVLRTTKHTAEEVTLKLQTATETEVQINAAREEYRPVAARGSILYFLIVEMSMVNVMYQTSLKQFLGLFDLSLDKAPKSPITSKRISNIITVMTYEVFQYAARGYYESHKTLFTLLMALKIQLTSKDIKHREFLTFIKGGASLDLNACPPKPCKWILDMTWLNLVELSKLQHFNDILRQIQNNERQWKQWFDKEAPEDAVIPDGYDVSLRVFYRLLLIRCWCPDRTMVQSRKYIVETLGPEFAEGVILDLEKMCSESNPRTPMICFLSMGSDPTIQIEALAKKMKVDCKDVSMGQGQEVHARRLLQHSMTNGGWALLQNCHLALEFLEELLDTVTETEEVDPSFRLWITTEVHPRFPITLLQTSIKFTNDPPQGLKAGLKRSYAAITQDQLEVSNMPQWKPMLYGVAFLHTTVQERRKFGPIGWNIPYEFNQADFNATVQFVQNHLDDMDIKKGVSWNTVRYMIGEIQYGGRVTDDYDKILLNTFAKVWFGDAMLQSHFRFYKGYVIPSCKTVAQYLDYIQGLPSTDTPEVFGLHPNADITYQTKSAKDILDTILSIQPKDSSSGTGETREDVAYRMAEDFLEKLPENYIPYEVRSRLKILGALQPMNIFLRQEIDRMQKVISLVRHTLLDLKLAIEGTIIMSENLRDALDCMYDGRIPAKWLKVSWPSSTLGFWFTELLDRNSQFRTWCFEGQPKSFWMTGFFNPQGFLTAMKQEVTRAHKGWALDSVVLHNDVTKFTSRDDVTTAPEEGVYVYGLFLEGAAWDKRNQKLTESKSKVLFEQMPIIHIDAVQGDTKQESKSFYGCPIYKKPSRTDLNYIAQVDLKTAVNPDTWVLRGVALLCDVK
ncbi:dynein axonemal heavy chain 5-like isoform X2 [Clavelina lepadiformis]|uniref:dynein axonemal heavy chain 5-like isoform X2 n=1 Tax=Clavelina lepadiformis TaxID=159417 RepID=UPI0040413FAC